MVSNKKTQRYEKNVLGRLDYGINTLREEGDFRNLKKELGAHLTAEDLLSGNNLNSTKLYKKVCRMDTTGTLSSRFTNDVVERIQNAHDYYQYEHRVEIFTPNVPFRCENLILKTLYSTYGSRGINANPDVQKKLKKRVIHTTSNWNGKLFGSIANQFGSFYGVVYPQVASFVEKESSILRGGSLDSDLKHFLTLSVDKFKDLRIVSPNNVNINTYIDPSQNEMTPKRERESYRLLGYTEEEINSLMQSK